MELVLLEGKTINHLPSCHCFYTLTSSAADQIIKDGFKKGILSKGQGQFIYWRIPPPFRPFFYTEAKFLVPDLGI